jgi:hypothetical protein
VEAVGHLRKHSELLARLPEGIRNHKRAGFTDALGPTLMAIKGYAAPEVEKVYSGAGSCVKGWVKLPDVYHS